MSQIIHKLSNYSLNEFRILVRKAMMLTKDEENIFYSIPENVWQEIYETNFNSELPYAQKVILGNTSASPIIHTETKFLERVKKNIDNFKLASQLIKDYIDNPNRKIVFLTDFDNDGSISQSVINQLYKVVPKELHDGLIIKYARSKNARGFSAEILEEICEEENIDKNEDFLIVTADNGINSVEEQIKINQDFPNATLLITDHHNPEPDMMIVENEKTVIFNPHYFALEHTNPEILKERKINPNKAREESYEFFSEYNISGATTIGLLISEYIKSQNDISKMSLSEQLKNRNKTQEINNILKIIDDLSKMSNMVDYVKTAPADKPHDSKEIKKGLQLQPLLNVNNTINNLIVNPMNDTVANVLMSKATDDNREIVEQAIKKIFEENKKILTINVYARKLLETYKDYLRSTDDAKKIINSNTKESILLTTIENTIANSDSMNIEFDGNNYIELLRPYIFELSFDDNKNNYQKMILDGMLDLYKKLSYSEKAIIKELRNIELADVIELNNISISVLNKDIQNTFNRKLLNKAYNRMNNGMLVNIDNTSDYLISGSFRSIYPISAILNEEAKEKIAKLGFKLETPGHDMAAGFILSSLNNQKIEISDIEKIAAILNDRIEQVASFQLENNNNKKYDFELITDIQALEFIGKFNTVIRGNVAHFARISPLIKINEDNLIHVNGKTGAQTLLSEKAEKENYGWDAIQSKLPSATSNGENLAIPISLLKELSQNGFKDYLKLDFVNSDIFIVNKLIKEDEIHQSLYIDKDYSVTDELHKFYSENMSNDSKIIHVTRDEIKDNPFFKFNRYSIEDFAAFEKTIIEIIDTNGVDNLTVLDVEADGFGNARLINIGFMSYKINEDTNNGITKVLSNDTNNILYGLNQRQYYIDDEKMSELIASDMLTQIDNLKVKELKSNSALSVLVNSNASYVVASDFYSELENYEVKNIKYTNDKIIINRTLEAETMSYLVRNDDFVISPAITKLTGITNDLSKQYGLPVIDIDNRLTQYFKDKTSLFVAHNTAYDGRIIRVNLNSFAEVFNSPLNMIADSATFSRDEKLIYDNIDIVKFQNIVGLENYYFYDNERSRFNLKDFILSDKNGEYPDIKNNIHLLKTKNNFGEYDFYIRDMKDNSLTIIKPIVLEYDNEHNVVGQKNISLRDLYLLKDNQNLIDNKNPVITSTVMPLNQVGYSAQALGENKFVRQLLLQKQDFKPIIIDNFEDYEILSLPNHKEKLLEFQKEYRFNKTPNENIKDFVTLYPTNDDAFLLELKEFTFDFLKQNKEIDSIYNDTWIYKTVLKCIEPNSYADLNKTNYEIVSQLTGIPVDIVSEVMQEAYDFKQTYKDDGCKNIITKEVHMNGPYKGNIVGDIAYEDKAWALLLSEKHAGRFINATKETVDLFNQHQQNFAINFTKQNLFATDIVQDSASFKQTNNFVVRDENGILKQLQHKQETLENYDATIINYGLTAKEAQEGKNVVLVKRDGVIIDNDIIENDAKKLAFIVSIMQVGHKSIKLPVDGIFEDNIEKMQEYKDDLAQRYSYIEINNSFEQIDNYIKQFRTFMSSKNEDFNVFDENDELFDAFAKSNTINKAKRANTVDGLDVVTYEQLEKVEKIIYSTIITELKKSHGMAFDFDDEFKEDQRKLIQQIQDGQIDENYRFHNVEFEQVSEFISDMLELKMSNNNELKEKLGIKQNDYTYPYAIRNIVENIVPDVEHDNLKKSLAGLLVNSIAMSNKYENPPRIVKALNDRETFDFAKDNNNDIASDNFLSEKHSIIKRKSPIKHLVEKMDYIDVSYNVICSKIGLPLSIEFDVITPDEEIKKKQKNERKNGPSLSMS